MLKTVFAICCLAGAATAQNSAITAITSAATPTEGIAAGSLATIIGSNLATQTASANTSSWPTDLGGVRVMVTDSRQVTRPAGLIYVSPSQINLEMPDGTAAGPATVTVGSASAQVQVAAVAPALFAINQANIAAATAVRVVLPTQMQGPVAVFQCGATPESCQLTPIDVGVDAPVYLSVFGTGIRNRSSLDNVTVTIGNTTVPAIYAGPQPQTPGLDQVNVPLPLSLRGAGAVNVIVTVDGVTSNAVKIAIM